MTETEWLECTDPQPLFEFVSNKTSDRKLRLFACACCRHLWDRLQLKDPRSCTAVEVAERFADGLATKEKLSAAVEDANEARMWGGYAVEAAYAAACGFIEATLAAAARELAPSPSTRAVRRVFHAELLREIVGHPFRIKSVETSTLAWNDGTIPKFAQVIYEQRGFDRLPILADALEDAGCDNADILAHCRSDGVHVRGCWVIDLLLGKQ